MHSKKSLQRKNKIKELVIALSTRIKQLDVEGVIKSDYFGEPIDLSVSLRETLFLFRCKWRRWDGVVTPTDMENLIKRANYFRDKQKFQKSIAVLASDSGIPWRSSRSRDESCERLLFLVGSIQDWVRIFCESVVVLTTVYHERCCLEKIVKEELDRKRAKNFRAALAAAIARFIDLQVIENTVSRVEKKRIHSFLWWLRTGYPPREAMFQLFPTYSVRAIAPFSTEITRNHIEPKRPEMHHLIERCYENLLLRLPDEQLYSNVAWRGNLYSDIQRLATSNLTYYDDFVVASPVEAPSSKQVAIFIDHYKPSSKYEEDNPHGAYEFDNYFRVMVNAFWDKIPRTDELCRGDKSLDPEVHFLHSLFDVLAQQLSKMPIYQEQKHYRKGNLKLNIAYNANLWPIISASLNEPRGDIHVQARFNEMTPPRQLYEKFYEFLCWHINCAGHRYLEEMRRYQQRFGADFGFALGRDGLYCALGQFIQDIFKFIGRWEELPWYEKWRRKLTRSASKLIPVRSIARKLLKKSCYERSERKGQSDAHSLFNVCIRMSSLSNSAFQIDRNMLTYYNKQYPEANSYYLRDLYINRVLSGFCNVANLLSKGTPLLLAETILALSSEPRLMESNRIVGIPTMGVIFSSLLSLILRKKMSIAHVHLSLNIWPRPSPFECFVICDDGVQTGFTLYSLLNEFKKNLYKVAEIPLTTIYRYKDSQIDDFAHNNPQTKGFDIVAKLDSIRRKVKSCFDFHVIETEPENYNVECLSDLTDRVSVDAAEALTNDIKKRILSCSNGGHSLEVLKKRVRRVCNSGILFGKFYKPCLLFEHPDLMLNICGYFYEICKSKRINTLIARNEFGVPLAVGICLIHIFSGAENRLNLLIAQKEGKFIEGLFDLIQEKPDGDEFEIATIGNCMRSQSSESVLERTLNSASLDNRYVNPHRYKLEVKTVFNVFRPTYLKYVEPIGVKETDIHTIVKI